MIENHMYILAVMYAAQFEVIQKCLGGNLETNQDNPWNESSVPATQYTK